MPDIMMDLLGSMLPAPEYATKEYVQARIAEAMNTAGSGPSVVLEPATFTANGSYQPDPGKAWDDVVVNVPALESVSGTITPASDGSYASPSIVHNLGTYDVFVILYVDDENYTELLNGGYSSAQVLKITAVLGTLNKESHVKKFGCSTCKNGTVQITTCSIHSNTTINKVQFSLANATWFRAGITYKFTVVKYGENTTEMGA